MTSSTQRHKERSKLRDSERRGHMALQSCRLSAAPPYTRSQVTSSPLIERAFKRWWMATITGDQKKKERKKKRIKKKQQQKNPKTKPGCGHTRFSDTQNHASPLHMQLPSRRIPNTNPFAPSLIPSIWPPKVTFRHRPLEEGCLIAFLLCR